MEPKLRKMLIKCIRKNTVSVRASVYDMFGFPLKTPILPLWYSDTCKLCYPKGYFTQREIDSVVQKVSKYIAENKLEVKIEVSNGYRIEALHTTGWKIKLR